MNRNPRIGGYYLLAAALSGLAALRLPLLSPFLCWTALSTGLLAAGYVSRGAEVYGKRRGRLPLFRGTVMLPVRLGQWLSLLHYRRQANPRDEILPGLFIGGVLTAEEVRRLIASDITGVLDVTAEFSESPALLRLCYRNIPVLDLTAPTPSQLREGVAFIHTQLEAGQKVYVHCKAGYSRSAAMVGAYLLHTGHALNVQDAVSLLMKKRPSMVIRPEIRRALENFRKNQPSPSKPHPGEVAL